MKTITGTGVLSGFRAGVYGGLASREAFCSYHQLEAQSQRFGHVIPEVQSGRVLLQPNA